MAAHGIGAMGRDYASVEDESFIARFRAQCHCETVQYEVRAEPVDAKICHCLDCQTLHGAPMQWAAIFHKRDVRLTAGAKHLLFYNSGRHSAERALPCKVRCARCGTPIADEGRRMWLAFPTLFDFGHPRVVPESFKPTCHIFYGSRVIEVADTLPKWSGHKGRSALLSATG